jgi:hypothetical protein
MRWPVFLASYQHGDHPEVIRIGDRVTWPLLLSDGLLLRWPHHLLAHTRFKLEALSTPADLKTVGVLVAARAGLRARWAGRGEANLQMSLSGLLTVDYLTPPYIESTGIVSDLLLLTQTLENDRSGRLVPGWKDWSTSPVGAVPSTFAGDWGGIGSAVQTGVVAILDIKD